MMPFTLSRHPFAGRAGILPEKAAVFRRFRGRPDEDP